MDVSIIIVNYNTLALTQKCLNSIFKYTTEISFEVILIDNNSNDGSFEHFNNDSRIHYIYNKDNKGFGKANNLGVEKAKGKYIFFLNSDTILLNNAIKILFDHFERNKLEKNLGVLGCYLYDEKMDVEDSYIKFPTVCDAFKAQLNIISKKLLNFKFFKYDRINYHGIKSNIEVDYIVGAAMMIEKNVFLKFKGFSEEYFLYFEETDLQKRMHIAGYKNTVITGPEIIHYKGQSLKGDSSYLKRRTHYFKSMFLYFRKNHTFLEYLFLKSLLIPLLIRFLFIIKYPLSLRIKFISTIIKS